VDLVPPGEDFGEGEKAMKMERDGGGEVERRGVGRVVNRADRRLYSGRGEMDVLGLVNA